MPFKSQAQARLMFATKPAMAKEFADATPSIKNLPQHVAAKRLRKKHLKLGNAQRAEAEKHTSYSTQPGGPIQFVPRSK